MGTFPALEVLQHVECHFQRLRQRRGRGATRAHQSSISEVAEEQGQHEAGSAGGTSACKLAVDDEAHVLAHHVGVEVLEDPSLSP
eukprot:4559693-Alexandrium_andersonii.AAC.1